VLACEIGHQVLLVSAIEAEKVQKEKQFQYSFFAEFEKIEIS
jgi:hypothetical protein